jgi:hypothetical protein
MIIFSHHVIPFILLEIYNSFKGNAASFFRSDEKATTKHLTYDTACFIISLRFTGHFAGVPFLCFLAVGL